MEYLNILLNEIRTLNIDNLIMIVIVFSLFYWISNRLKRTFFKLFVLIFAVLVLKETNYDSILLSEDIVIAVALIIPQIKFIFSFVLSILNSIKVMTANTYFFFISIFYKIVRFFRWIIDILLVIKRFFSRTKKEENSSYNNEEQSNYDYSKQENNYSSRNSYNDFKNDEYEKRKQRQYDDFRNSSNETYEEPIKDEYEHVSDELKRFYSSSAYIILGVSEGDNFPEIKKTYRNLISIYHPDLNPDNIELYTEISQNINEAYSKLKKVHGK